MSDKQTIAILNDLVRLSYDSERGFNVVAQTVSNRGLKALLKTYAQQRAQFRSELQAEIERLNGNLEHQGSFLAGIHRGWINIKAVMTLGNQNVENVALSESARGESYALSVYQKSLKSNLPQDSHELVERQASIIENVFNQLSRMRGIAGRRLVVRLYNEDEDAEWAIEKLEKAGFGRATMQTLALDQIIQIYSESDETGNTTSETIRAGALGGTAVGALLGFIAGLGVLFVPQMGITPMGGIPGTLLGSFIAGAIIGAIFGSLFGALIGRGTTQEDVYVYAESIAEGKVLLLAEVDSDRAKDAARIMRQVDVSTATT